MSEVFQNLVVDHLEVTLGSVVRVANGYYYDLLPENILDIRRNLETDGVGLLRASIYSSEWDCESPGTNAALSQVHKRAHFHIDLCLAIQDNAEREINRALADAEKAVTKDISQGGTCINTFVKSCTKWGLSPSGYFHATLNFDVELRHAANDPSAEYQTTYN